MQTQEASTAKLTTVAVFPENSFLENLAVRADGSILVTEILQGQLRYVPPEGVPADQVPVHTFGRFTMGVVEAGPDVYYINTSDPFSARKSYLHRLDLRQWNPGEPERAEIVLEFPAQAGGLNGSCLLAPGVIVLADSLAGLIWRVDLPAVGGGTPTARDWLQHDSLAATADSADVLGIVPQQPGVNGVSYAARTHYLYYTSTGQKLFMRVPVDPSTHDPAGPAEFVASGKLDQPTSRYGTGRYAPRTALLANLCDEHRLGDRNLHVDAPVSRSVIGPGHRRRAHRRRSARLSRSGRDGPERHLTGQYVTPPGRCRYPGPAATAPAKDSCPLPGHLGHSSTAICCVSLG